MFSVTDFEPSSLRVSPLTKGRRIETAWLDARGQPVYVTLNGLKVPFPPSVYNGTGNEAKKNICFSLDDAHQGLHELEQNIREAGAKVIGAAHWNNWIRPETDGLSALLKCKVNEATQYFDSACQPVPCPSDDEWRGLTCNARVLVKAIWVHNKTAGLLADVTDLQVLDRQETRECPFQNLRT